MFAPWPTNIGVSLVLLACLTDSSLASTAMTTCTVYFPLAAVHVPRLTGLVVAPGLIVPENEPLSVVTVLPLLSLRVSVTPCEPPADATVPWFLMATENVTVLPAAGLPGVQLTGEATRSELWTGFTTRLVGLV